MSINEENLKKRLPPLIFFNELPYEEKRSAYERYLQRVFSCLIMETEDSRGDPEEDRKALLEEALMVLDRLFKDYGNDSV